MNDRARGIVVAHAALAAGLVEAVRAITGDEQTLTPVSNDGCDRETLAKRVAAAVGDGPCVVFVDLPGGSCFVAAARMMRERGAFTVVSGVNLPMLVEFVTRQDADPERAGERAVESGGRAIRVARV